MKKELEAERGDQQVHLSVGVENQECERSSLWSQTVREI